jgi:hypothetical protein
MGGLTSARWKKQEIAIQMGMRDEEASSEYIGQERES